MYRGGGNYHRLRRCTVKETGHSSFSTSVREIEVRDSIAGKEQPCESIAPG